MHVIVQNVNEERISEEVRQVAPESTVMPQDVRRWIELNKDYVAKILEDGVIGRMVREEG